MVVPYFDRAWIIPTWFKYIENQNFPLEDIGFIFELGPNDEETCDLLWDWHLHHPEVQVFDGIVREGINHRAHPDGKRVWQKNDYERMALFRNNLLDRAICYEPDRYLSLDCDLILENPDTLSYLYALTETRDAVSPLMYMSPDVTQFPGVMTWVDSPGGRARRLLDDYPMGEIFEADIIMAGVMMSKEVYSNSRYRWHPQGEDLGWSTDCGEKGYKLHCASNLYVPHIMHTWMLEHYNRDGDPRAAVTNNVG